MSDVMDLQEAIRALKERDKEVLAKRLQNERLHKIAERFDKYMHAQYCLEPSVRNEQLQSVWNDVERIESFLESKRAEVKDGK